MPRTPFENRQREDRQHDKRQNPKKKSFRKRASDAPTWDGIPADIVHTIVCVCTTHGASPTFSYTRDGTSLVCAVYYDGNRYPDYLAGVDEVTAYLDWLAYDLLELDEDELDLYPVLASKSHQDAPPPPLAILRPEGGDAASPGASQSVRTPKK